MASISRLMRKIKFISNPGQEILIGAFLYHTNIKVFLRYGKMRAGTIAQNRDPKPLSLLTIHLLKQLAILSPAKDAITVVVEHLIAGLPARVDVRVEFVAVSTLPVVASERGDVGEGVVVQVEGWVVLVAEAVHEQVPQPFPGRDFGGGWGWGTEQ